MKLPLRLKDPEKSDWLVVNFNPSRYVALMAMLGDDGYEIFPLIECLQRRKPRSKRIISVERQIIPGFMFIRHPKRAEVSRIELELKYQMRPFLFNAGFVRVSDQELKSMVMTVKNFAKRRAEAAKFHIGDTVVVTQGVFVFFGHAVVSASADDMVTVTFKKYSQEMQISAWLLAKVPV